MNGYIVHEFAVVLNSKSEEDKKAYELNGERFWGGEKLVNNCHTNETIDELEIINIPKSKKLLNDYFVEAGTLYEYYYAQFDDLGFQDRYKLRLAELVWVNYVYTFRLNFSSFSAYKDRTYIDMVSNATCFEGVYKSGQLVFSDVNEWARVNILGWE